MVVSLHDQVKLKNHLKKLPPLVARPGIPVDRLGIPADHPGIPVDCPGIPPFHHPGIPSHRLIRLNPTHLTLNVVRLFAVDRPGIQLLRLIHRRLNPAHLNLSLEKLLPVHRAGIRPHRLSGRLNPTPGHLNLSLGRVLSVHRAGTLQPHRPIGRRNPTHLNLPLGRLPPPPMLRLHCRTKLLKPALLHLRLEIVLPVYRARTQSHRLINPQSPAHLNLCL